MTPPGTGRLRLLRVALVFCGCTWSAALLGVFATWEAASQAMQGLGAQPIAYDPMLDYWLRMAAGAFAFVGFGYLLLAVNPDRHADLLPWAGGFMIAEGMVLLAHGWRLDLPPFPFYADVSACLLGGAAVIALRGAAAITTADRVVA